MYTVLYIKTS